METKLSLKVDFAALNKKRPGEEKHKQIYEKGEYYETVLLLQTLLFFSVVFFFSLTAGARYISAKSANGYQPYYSSGGEGSLR